MTLAEDYHSLSPDLILDAIDEQGFETNAQILALNSYENRVYQIGIEDASPIIVKFYRPGRWSDEQILEEHAFAKQLSNEEIPVVAPWENKKGETLFLSSGFRLAIYERKGGYSPEPGDLDQLVRLGTLLGRIHASAANKTFLTRDSISMSRNFIEPVNYLLEQHFIPAELEDAYKNITNTLIEDISSQINDFKNISFIKCHGDWHLGNILWRGDDGGHIVDLDDCVNAPAVQDIWMMLSGERKDQSLQLSAILEGYRQFNSFNLNELKCIESLRTMRLVYYTAWLAKRWEDPAFPKNFPWFNTQAYWQQHIREVEQQIDQVNEEPLNVY